MSDKTKLLTRLVHAHANLNAMSAVIVLMEGGITYGPSTHSSEKRIITIAKAEVARQLAIYDELLERLDTPPRSET